MPIAIPGLDALHARLLDDYVAYFPDDDTSTGSDVWFRTRVLALLAWQQLHAVRVLELDLLPDTATGAFLDRIGRIYGVPRKGATSARKAQALRIVGVVGAAVTSGAELVHVSGLRFRVAQDATVPAAGRIDVDVVAIDTGSATRLSVGQVLSFVSPAAGIESDAELQRDLDDDGVDAELDDVYRVRVLDRIAQPSMGGNDSDYRAWALEVPGIASAYVYPHRRGRGSVELAALHAGRGAVRALSMDERAALATYITSERPTAMKSFRVLATPTRAVNVELAVSVLPGSGLRWDFQDAGGPLVVARWDESARVLSFEADRPSDLRAGHRLVIAHLSGGGSGAEVKVEQLGPGPADVTLATVPDEAPVAGDPVHSGGDVVAPVRARVLALFDSLGPAVGARGVGDWLDAIEPDALLATALQERGVRRGEPIEPVEAVVPIDSAFPNDDTVELLVPGRVLIRRLL